MTIEILEGLVEATSGCGANLCCFGASVGIDPSDLRGAEKQETRPSRQFFLGSGDLLDLGA